MTDSLPARIAEAKARADCVLANGIPPTAKTLALDIWILADQLARAQAEAERLREHASKMRTVIEAARAFGQFSDVAVEVDEDDNTGHAVWVRKMGGERICDWLGPSDFARITQALADFDRGEQG